MHGQDDARHVENGIASIMWARRYCEKKIYQWSLRIESEMLQEICGGHVNNIFREKGRSYWNCTDAASVVTKGQRLLQKT